MIGPENGRRICREVRQEVRQSCGGIQARRGGCVSVYEIPEQPSYIHPNDERIGEAVQGGQAKDKSGRSVAG